MPALFLPDSPTAEEIKVIKTKKPLKHDLMSPNLNGFSEEEKLSKKKKKHENSKAGDGERKKKKRKGVEEDELSNTSSDAVETVPRKKEAVNGSLLKKPRVMEEEEEEDDGELTGSGEEDGGDADPNALTNFRISKVLRERLNSKGIKALFQIQAMTFNMIFEGSDLVGRARTGQVGRWCFLILIGFF